MDGFAQAAEAVRHGGSVGGTDSMAPSHPLWVAYARAMAPLFLQPAEALADLVLKEVPRPQRILDIAAGHGLFGIALGQSASGLARDRARLARGAARRGRACAQHRLGPRFRAIGGSAFETPLGADWDVVLLANFLHHFDPPTCEGLLRRVRESLAPGGVVALVEFVPNEDRVSPPAVAQFGMTMLATTAHGDVYTFSELARMLERTGFSRPVCTRSPTRRSGPSSRAVRRAPGRAFFKGVYKDI